MLISAKKLYLVGVVVAFSVAAAQSVQATTIVSGTGDILFYDNFESVTAATSITDTSAALPSAVIGTWDGVSNVGLQRQVINYADPTAYDAPGAFEGSNYLRLMRDSETTGLTGSITMTASFNEAATASEDETVNVSLMHYFSDDLIGTNRIGFYKVLDSSGKQLVRMYPKGDSATGEISLFYYPTGGGATIDSGLSFNFNEWVQFDINVDLVNKTYGLAVTDTNGYRSVTGIDFYDSTSSDAASFQILTSDSQSCVYLDSVAVPEPGSIALLISGLLAGVFMIRRKAER